MVCADGDEEEPCRSQLAEPDGPQVPSGAPQMSQDVGESFPDDGGQQERGACLRVHGGQTLGRSSVADTGSKSGPCLDSETSDKVPEKFSVSCVSTPDPGRDSDMEFQAPSEEVLRNMKRQTAEQLCLRKPEVSSEASTKCLEFFFGWLRTKHPCMGHVGESVHFDLRKREIRIMATPRAEKRRCRKDGQLYTFADTVNYSYEQGGSFDFALQMWRNDFDY